MSTTSTEKRKLPDLYKLVHDRVNAIKTDYGTTFSRIFPDITKPDMMIDPMGNKRLPSLSDYVELYKKAFEEHPPYAINDGDYHLRTEATATPGTINRIQYNEEEDRYYGLFNHSTIMKSDDLETWEDAMKLSVDEEYAFMNAEIEFFLFNLANTYYTEAKNKIWKNSDVETLENIGALKGTRIKEFRYMNGVYLIVVENCLGVPYIKQWIPTHPTSASDPIMKRAFTDHTTTGRKDAYYEIVYATDTISDPRRWKVVTSGPKAEWEGIISNRYDAGNNSDSVGNIAHRPHVREFADMDTDWRDTWTILMTNGDYFVSHDKFQSFTEQHVDNLAVQRDENVLNEYDNNRYPRMFNAISHYQYYDVDGFKVSADDLRTIILGGDVHTVPTLVKRNKLPINLDSNTSPQNNIWVVAGMKSEILLSHDLSTWVELPNIMKQVAAPGCPSYPGDNNPIHISMTITHLLKMGRGCTLSRFEFGLVAMPVVKSKTPSGYEITARNDDIIPYTFWFNVGRQMPSEKYKMLYEIDGLTLPGTEKVPVVQRSIIALESWEYSKGAWNSWIAQGYVTYEKDKMNTSGLYGIHNPNAEEYRPYWDIKNHRYYSMDYTIGCGITPDLPGNSPIGSDPTSLKYALTKYNLTMASGIAGRTRTDNMPLSYKVKLPGETTFTEIKRSDIMDLVFDMAHPSPSAVPHDDWDTNQVYDAIPCFSRSRHGFVVAYADTIREYEQSPDTGVLQMTNTVKIIPNMMKPVRLCKLYHYDMGAPSDPSKAPANDAKVKAPDLVGNSYFSSPYTVKYSPETGMYFAWERYNVDASLRSVSYGRADKEPGTTGTILPKQMTSIRFLQSYDGKHWERMEGPEFDPMVTPKTLPTNPPIIVQAFSTFSNLAVVPEGGFGFDQTDWTIKDICTFRGWDGTMHTIIMLTGGWYVHINKTMVFNPTKMYLFPLESVLWHRVYVKYNSNSTVTAAKNLPNYRGYNSMIITKGSEFNYILMVHPHMSVTQSVTGLQTSADGGSTKIITTAGFDYITMENDSISYNFYPVADGPNSTSTNFTSASSGTTLPINTTIKFPMYQMYVSRMRKGSAAINGKFILHRYNEMWRTYNTTKSYSMYVQGALNQPDNVEYDNIDTTSKKAAKGSYIGPQLYQNSSSITREDLALYENASPGYINHVLDATAEAEGNSVLYMANPLGHYNYNLFMLIGNLNAPAVKPVPVMSYRTKGFANGFTAITASNYGAIKQYTRDFGSGQWSFFDRGTDEAHSSAIRTAFENAVQMSMGHHDREGIVTNKGHFYVNFMEVQQITNGGTNRGIRTLPAAVDLSMMPYDFNNIQVDDKTVWYAKSRLYGMRPTRILTYDGMTIYNYPDHLLYRNYGKMDVAHDVLLQAYNDKTEAIYGRAGQSMSNPFVEGSLLQKENNKLFLTSPTGQLSLVEMERPADIDDIGTTKCLVDPDTMTVQYGTRRELETKEEWRPIYNADIDDPFATNQMVYNRVLPTTATTNKSLVEKTLGVTTSGKSMWAGPKVRTWKDFIFIVDRGNLRILSKHWQDGWTDDYPVMVSLDSNGNGTGTKIYILDVLLLDACDTVDPFVTKRDSVKSSAITQGSPKDNPQAGMAMLYLVCNTMLYGMAISSVIMSDVNVTESKDPKKPAGPLDNVFQRIFQGIIAGTVPESLEIAKMPGVVFGMVTATAPFQAIQTSSTSFVTAYQQLDGTNKLTKIRHMHLPLNGVNTPVEDRSVTITTANTSTYDQSRILHSGPLIIRATTGTKLVMVLDAGSERIVIMNFDMAAFYADAKRAGFVQGTYTEDNVGMFLDFAQDIAFNPDSGEIIFMVKTVGSTATTGNLDKSNLGLMKYRIKYSLASLPPEQTTFYGNNTYLDNTANPLQFLGSARCDHIDLVDMEYYNHQWIAVGYKAPYTLDRYGSTAEPTSKQNNASLGHPSYDPTHPRPTAQNILHACYSKDGLNWGEFYNLEVARSMDTNSISKVDKPYLIVDNERGNCLIYDGAGRILAKTISKKYALENQVILGEQTNIYAKAVWRGYDYNTITNEGSNSTVAGCDIVIGAIYPEYMFGESFDIVHLSGIEIMDSPTISETGTQNNISSHVMDFHSLAIAAFDSFNLGVNDRQDTKAYQYPYDIDYNANGRSGGLYTQYYHSLTTFIGSGDALGGANYIPLDVVQQRSIPFYRANNPNSKNYDYPIWDPMDMKINTIYYSGEWFPSNREVYGKPESGAIKKLGVWAYPRQEDKRSYPLYEDITSTDVDANIDPTSSVVGKFVDYDYSTGRFWEGFDWKKRSNHRFEYSPIALTQNLTTKHGYITLYQGRESTVLYFPSVGKVWIHFSFLGGGVSGNYDAQYLNGFSNTAQMTGIHRVESGSYSYSYVTIIGRKMETLHTYDQQVNIAPVIASPCLQMFDQS